ncbi:peptide ABC transporter permease [Pradoshia sp.]
MFKWIIRSKSFMAGFLFLSVLMLLSIGNTLFNDGEIRRDAFLSDENGTIIAAPPYPPFTVFPLGSDLEGYDLLHMMIEGAKITIGIALMIAVLRIALGLLIGSLLGMYARRWIAPFEKIFSSFTLIPLSLVAAFLLHNVLMMQPDGFENPFWQRALFEVFILTIYAVPTLAIFQANEIKRLHDEDFMEAASVLGGGPRHKMKVHIFPHLKENLMQLSIQQFIQVLIVLSHLGVLNLFFGGTYVDYGGSGPPKSMYYEWSGLVGVYIRSLNFHPWIALVPIAFFTLTILAAQLMLNGLKKADEQANEEKKIRHAASAEIQSDHDESFTLSLKKDA